MNNVNCPYCNCPNEVYPDEDIEEDVAHEEECDRCEKKFIYYTKVSVTYHPKQADCLNGSPHPFREWLTMYERKGMMTERRHCMTCDHSESRVTPVTGSPTP